MGDQVHPETISRRSEILRELAAAKQEAFARSLVGTVREAVVEAESELPGWRTATTDNYVTVMLPEAADGSLVPGALVEADIRDYREGRLFAGVKRTLQLPAIAAKGA
jgi:tRNA A37 methylthiotransferase MiaB